VEALKELGLYNEGNIKEVSYHNLSEDVDNVIAQLMKQRNKVDGIFFATNSISIAGIRSLFKHGVMVQKDIQVMCFDESEAIVLFPFRIPYIKQPVEEMAKTALTMLIDQIEKRESTIRTSLIRAELIK
jgi:LacI family transcriptional regulator